MRQSASHSRWEVGVDFCISIAINIGIQALTLSSFTVVRGLSFTAVFLTLALLRRYVVRRCFNRMVTSEDGQSRAMSLVESSADTALAVALAFALTLFWYPGEPLARITGLIVASYALAFARRFALRRLFEWLPRRQRESAPAPSA
jgi:hypothetical protein